MNGNKSLRILLWNALTIADQLGARLTHTEADASRLAMDMGEESELFEWEHNQDGTVTFIRKEIV